MSSDPNQRLLLDKAAMAGAVKRLAKEICEKNRGARQLALIGIHKRGVPLAWRIADEMRGMDCTEVLVGTVDITQYRDDLAMMKMVPKLEGSDIPFDIDDAQVVLCDEVLFTGRSVRAAINELLDHGRPARVQLAVLIDRDGREFPIQPDYIGERVTIGPEERVAVRFEEVDGDDAVHVQTSKAVK
ncbi:MAG: bifunctional pyr operon transcriptional regulator/uracil phosphoribosyltransferase PyrR [Verrucomicrobiaceae bacterium]|nr:bifunctional pyr operon transcriptional regulator/uracil phosphoribosyltransferase PyrR [Verrucomicrobiaceae bacterium]